MSGSDNSNPKICTKHLYGLVDPLFYLVAPGSITMGLSTLLCLTYFWCIYKHGKYSIDGTYRKLLKSLFVLTRFI